MFLTGLMQLKMLKDEIINNLRVQSRLYLIFFDYPIVTLSILYVSGSHSLTTNKPTAANIGHTVTTGSSSRCTHQSANSSRGKGLIWVNAVTGFPLIREILRWWRTRWPSHEGGKYCHEQKINLATNTSYKQHLSPRGHGQTPTFTAL